MDALVGLLRGALGSWPDRVPAVIRRLLGAIAVVLVLNHSAVSAAAWRCPAKPVEPCSTRHGRLSSQNGIGLTVWLIGTTRVVAVENDFDELPARVRRYLSMTSPDHSYVFGDFDVCPLEADRPGHMRRVCIAGAEKLVVQNLRGSRPAFRLLSTWPRKQPDDAPWPWLDVKDRP